MIDTLENGNSNHNEVIVVKKEPKTVNSILIIAAALIFAAVVLSYFVKDLNIFANLTLKELTSGALWVCFGCFSFSEIVKIIAINRAKATQEYKTIKEETDKHLTQLSESGALRYADEYCKHYERELLKETRNRLLSSVGVQYDIYLKSYLSKSFFYLLKNHKNLSFKQVLAICRANRVKQITYNADFLRTTVKVRKNVSPSETHNSDRKNTTNTIVSLFTSLGSGMFAFTIARDLVLDFSFATVVEAAIKVAVIIATSAFRASFGWNLILDTEVERLKLQQSESKKCVKWSKERYPEYFSSLNVPQKDGE